MVSTREPETFANFNLHFSNDDKEGEMVKVGFAEGFLELADGLTVGERDGTIVGNKDIIIVGLIVGVIVGFNVVGCVVRIGCMDGLLARVGTVVGRKVGPTVCITVGEIVGV